MKRLIFSLKRIKLPFLTLISVLILSGCEGLPDNVTREVEQMPYEQSNLKNYIKKQNELFVNLNNHPEGEFLNFYSEKENWQQNFDKANSELQQAETLYQNKIEPLYDDNNPETTIEIKKLNLEFYKVIKQSKLSANFVNQRITFLMNALNTAPEIESQAKQNLTEMEQLKEQEISKVKTAISDYPNKTDDLNARVEYSNLLITEALESEKQMSIEYSKVGRDKVDYAVFADQANNIQTQLSLFKNHHKTTSNKISELYQSYIKVLVDQRVDYFIVIKRASWCEGEYCGNGSTKTYKAIKVDSKVYDVLDKLTSNNIATIRRSWGNEKLSINIPKDIWRALSINERNRWPSGHTHADYWIEKSYSQAFHKYAEIKNDKMTELNWQKVDEAFYWKQHQNLGMAVLTKPYGYYKEDALTDAQPVGMATVAKPNLVDGVASGSNQYGEWRRSNGNSFWHYYGMYSMFNHLIGPSRYGYNDWNGYSGRRRGFGYYGSNQQYGTFGSNTYSNSRYQNSRYAKNNASAVYGAKTGNRTSGASSIRGANSSNRNRGPSSRGK